MGNKKFPYSQLRKPEQGENISLKPKKDFPAMDLRTGKKKITEREEERTNRLAFNINIEGYNKEQTDLQYEQKAFKNQVEDKCSTVEQRTNKPSCPKKTHKDRTKNNYSLPV